MPWPLKRTIWGESWQMPEVWLKDIEDDLRQQGARVTKGETAIAGIWKYLGVCWRRRVCGWGRRITKGGDRTLCFESGPEWLVSSSCCFSDRRF